MTEQRTHNSKVIGLTPIPPTDKEIFMYRKDIFVFGSNLAGRHGKGAALYALRNHGAIYGQAYGLQGHSFAIPTKDQNIKTLPLNKIQEYVNQFINFARENPLFIFHLTRIGCGLAGYTDSDIAPMFNNTPPNIIKPKGW